MHKLATAAMPQLDSFGSQEFSNLARACTTVASVKIPLLGAMAGAICTSPRPLELSNGARASASAQLAGTTLAQRPAQLAPIGGLSPEGLAITARAPSEPQLRGAAFSEAAAAAAAGQVSDFAPEEFRMLLWTLPRVALDSALSLSKARRVTAQCLSALLAEAEQRGLNALEAELLQRIGLPSQDPENPDANRRTE
ncbi:unnamed protein product [Effrenium voratum]|nr:unnamed protein product [Effrenium voratum]